MPSHFNGATARRCPLPRATGGFGWVLGGNDSHWLTVSLTCKLDLDEDDEEDDNVERDDTELVDAEAEEGEGD